MYAEMLGEKMLQEKLDEIQNRVKQVERITKLSSINMCLGMVITFILFLIQPAASLISGLIAILFAVIHSEALMIKSVHKMNIFILEVYLKEVLVLNKIKNHNIEGLSVEDAIKFREEVVGPESFNTLRVSLALISHKNVESKINEVEQNTIGMIADFPESSIYQLMSRFFGRSK